MKASTASLKSQKDGNQNINRKAESTEKQKVVFQSTFPAVLSRLHVTGRRHATTLQI